MMGIGSVFSGSGYNIPYLISSMIGKWGVQVPLLFIVVYILKLPVYWVWISFILSNFAEMVVMLIAYSQGKWETMRV